MPTLIERQSEYVAHETAGVNFYNAFRAQLSLDIEGGIKTLPQGVAIKEKLYKVARELKDGDWKSAHYFISSLVGDDNVSDMELQALKTDIETYITENYSW